MTSAYDEFLTRHILLGKVYEDLPARIKAVIAPQDWKVRVKDQCIQKGLVWADCLASTVCSEPEYYDDLVKAYKAWMRIYPYHLADYVCRVQRVTPFKFYCDVLTNMLKDEKSYDRMPNFTAADIVRVLGIGRNEYIAMLNQCKGRRLMWRMNPKGLARELLPTQPCRPQVQPWWLVSVVNIGEPEYRELAPEEVANLKTANLPEPIRVQDLEQEVLMGLYRRGLVYFDVPVLPEDRFSIPPLEGFVSNRTPTVGEAADPFEALLYSVFVASSESLKVSDLAQILNVGVALVQTALSIAVRLGFATRLREESVAKRSTTLGLPLIDLDDDSNSATGTGGGAGSGAASVMLGDFLFRTSSSGGGTAGGPGGPEQEGGRAVALLLDAEATSYLMMGALSPGLKRHSVTLFEGGRVAGEAVMSELMAELWQSYEQGQGFEGDMLKLTHFVGAMAAALDAIKEGSGGRPLELLRKESLAGLPPAAACKVLYHAYCAVVPAAPLPGAPLPLSPDQPGPAYYGPVGAAAGPWLQLALYAEARCGPTSVVLLRGQRLHTLPHELRHCSHALIWPWRISGGGSAGSAPAPDSVWATAVGAAAAEGSPMVLVEAPFMLFMLNEALMHTAVMVQPCDGLALAAAQSEASVSAAAASAAAAAALATEAAGEREGPGVGAAPHTSDGGNLIDFGEEDERSSGTGRGAAGAAGSQLVGSETPGPSGPSANRSPWLGASAAAGGALLVDVPLPLEPETITGGGGGGAGSWGGSGDGPFAAGGKADAAAVSAFGQSVQHEAPIQGAPTLVQGVERHSSARGKVTLVPLPASVREAVRALGLSSCVGVLRMMLWPAPNPGEVAASRPQETQAGSKAPLCPNTAHRRALAWVPLSVSLGLPLQCLPLCRLVCARGLDAGFLSQEGRVAQTRGQAVLHAALQQLVADHQAEACAADTQVQLAPPLQTPRFQALRAPSAVLSLCSSLSPSLLDGAGSAPWAPGGQGSGADGGGTGAGGQHWVQEPQHNLYFDGTTLFRVDISYCLQGGSCSLLGW